MIKLFVTILEALRWLFGLAFPMFDRARSAQAEFAHPVGRWLARGFLGGVVVLLLWWLNRSERVALKYWIPYGLLGEFWLPLLSFLLYLEVWLGWWLYRLFQLKGKPLGSEFPDIDESWDQALKELEEADILLEHRSLFLVLGRSEGPEESLFQSPGLKVDVKRAPAREDAALHVVATTSGVWVMCPRVSALAQRDLEASGNPTSVSLGSLVEGPGPAGGTYAAGGGGATIRVQDLFEGGMERFLAKHHRRRASKKSADPELARARLRHLCRLIARDRGGYIPLNGVLVLLPVAASDPGADISGIAGACRSDLTTTFDSLRVRCPVLFLVCDMDKLDGFAELAERQPAAGKGDTRVGQRVPLLPELRSEDRRYVSDLVRNSVEWSAGSLLPFMVLSAYGVEHAGSESLDDVMKANSQLFRFLIALRERQERLAQLVSECLPTLPGLPILFGGCYFAGTGEEANQQAFGPGVLSRMVDDQDLVTWTADCLEEDAAAQRRARWVRKLLIGCISACAIVALALAVMLLFFSDGPGDSYDISSP